MLKFEVGIVLPHFDPRSSIHFLLHPILARSYSCLRGVFEDLQQMHGEWTACGPLSVNLQSHIHMSLCMPCCLCPIHVPYPYNYPLDMSYSCVLLSSQCRRIASTVGLWGVKDLDPEEYEDVSALVGDLEELVGEIQARIDEGSEQAEAGDEFQPVSPPMPLSKPSLLRSTSM